MLLKKLIDKGRFEKKAVCDVDQGGAFFEKIAEILPADPHCQGAGYQVHSLYFDTHSKKQYFSKLWGCSQKEKQRVRFYHQSKHLNAETKFKLDRSVLKEKVTLNLSVDDKLSDLLENVESEHLITLDRSTHPWASLMPQVMVSYYRRALILPGFPHIRITLDTHLRGHSLLSPEQSLFQLAQKGNCPNYLLSILEVKGRGRVPKWLKDVIYNYNIQFSTFSKYSYILENMPEQKFTTPEFTKEDFN